MQDATAILNEVSGGLDALATQAIAVVPQEQSFMEIHGWNMPAINKHEFAEYLRSPVAIIQSMTDRNMEEADFQALVQMPTRIAYFQANAIPQLPSPNVFHVYLTARSLIDRLTQILAKYANPLIDWKEIEDRKLLPEAQIKRLKQLDSRATKAASDVSGLNDKIALINSAHAAAESLPTDMESLSEARREISEVSKNLEDSKTKAGEAKTSAELRLREIEAFKITAEKLVENTEAAYSAATTLGLGKAFGDKANSLGSSTWWLGALLAATLALAGCISSKRISFIHDLMLKPPVSMQLLWVNVALTLISVAAPIWFAWILTKQIGQRFRLSEDYAFKASVAKAYEGYRREAASLDPEFAKRLFGLALDRIDEAPLRHVENENHGSPWHEFFSRKGGNEGTKTTIGKTTDIVSDPQP
jgi:hypothetical protein